jgi:hypothetical protein
MVLGGDPNLHASRAFWMSSDDDIQEATMTKTTRLILLLGAIVLGGFAVGAVPACQRDLSGAHCPCVSGYTCCADNSCRPTGMCGGGPILIDGGACVPPGRATIYTTVAEQEALIEGDWLRCSGTSYPAAIGIGIRFSPDHTWNALEVGDAGDLAPITTGFDGYGTWMGLAQGGGRFQFNLFGVGTGSGDIFFVIFLDSGHLQMNSAGGTAPNIYRRPEVSCPCVAGDGDGGGGADAGDANTSASHAGDAGSAT